jgi:hypothetical protein
MKKDLFSRTAHDMVLASRSERGIMRRAVLYLRVSTIDQTTANQERELREIAARMGCDIGKVYKDHGISGAKGGGTSAPHWMHCAAMPAGGSSMS